MDGAAEIEGSLVASIGELVGTGDDAVGSSPGTE